MPKRKNDFLRLQEPCYVFSGNPRWRTQLNGPFPHAPPDYLTLLNPSNHLCFRLLGYGEHGGASKALREATHSAQYLQMSASGRTGVNDVEASRISEVLLGLDGVDNTAYLGYYLAAAIYRERKSREEFIVVVGSVDEPEVCFTVRFSELSNDLTFRFAPQKRQKGPTAVDFCLQTVTSSRLHLRTFICEYFNLTKDLSINPWTIRDGAAIYDPRRYAGCRKIPFSDGYLAKSGEWVVPTSYHQKVLYESAKIF